MSEGLARAPSPEAELDGADTLGALFPEAPRPPSPEPTIVNYTRDAHVSSAPDTTPSPGDDVKELSIRLVGSHPLWAHHLWNAALVLASYIDTHKDICRGRHVLELGAGGGLPGLICTLNGATAAVLSDYPDASLISNLWHNVSSNIPSDMVKHVDVQGYIWGTPLNPLIEALPSGRRGFDLIIMSDLIFNHSQHDALLKTCELALLPAAFEAAAPHSPPQILVFYTHHRPQFAERDMQFFTKAKESGWRCEQIVEERRPPMFPDDPGAEEVRGTVWGWKLTRSA